MQKNAENSAKYSRPIALQGMGYRPINRNIGIVVI